MFHLAILGLGEWWPILIIVVLLFGASKLPALARSLGASVNEFKKGAAEGIKDEKSDTEVRSSKSAGSSHSVNGKDH